MSDQTNSAGPARFQLSEIAAGFPEQAATMLLDRYLVDRETSSARVFRVYRPTPAHLHRHCDEHLLVLSGRGVFWMGDPSTAAPFGPGAFLFFPRNTVHAMPEMGTEPVVFLAIDTPRRQPDDVVFVNAAEGSAEEFIRQL